jgi:hypothetical protein
MFSPPVFVSVTVLYLRCEGQMHSLGQRTAAAKTSLEQSTRGVTLAWAKGYQHHTVKSLGLLRKDLRTQFCNDSFIQISSRDCGIQHTERKHCTKHCLYTRQNKQCEICCYLSGNTGSEAVSLVARLPTFRSIVEPSP